MFTWFILLHYLFGLLILQVNANGFCNASLTQSLGDDQFSASSVYDEVHNASAAKWNGEGWIAKDWDAMQYLKLDLQTIFEITKMNFKDSSISWMKLERFRIFHSLDGLHWNAYNTYLSDQFLGEKFIKQDSTFTIQLNPTLKTRYIAFNPVSFRGWPLIRVELFGCSRDDLPTNDVITRVNTDIETNTEWIPSQSPIVIDRRIEIRPLAKVTIQAGVTVIFTSNDAGLHVYGTLLSTGSDGFKNIFTSSHPVSLKSASWEGIKLQSNGNISLSHTIIRQADSCIEGHAIGMNVRNSLIYGCVSGVKLSEGEQSKSHVPAIAHTDILYNQNGMVLHGTESRPYFHIDYVKLSWNSNNGLIIDDWDRSGSKLTTSIMISNSSLDSNSYNGFSYSYDGDLTLSVDNSTFSKNNRNGLYMQESFTKYIFSFEINNSFFIENLYTGLYISMHCWTCYNQVHTFKGNTFNNNVRQQLYLNFLSHYASGDNHVQLNIENNIFLEHTYNSGPALLIDTTKANVNIVGNLFNQSFGGITIKGKVGKEVISIVTNNSFYHIYGETNNLISVTNGKLNFSSNIAKECSVPTLIDLLDGIEHYINQNIFSNNDRLVCLINVGEEYVHRQFITADYNYWGTNDFELIKAIICDVFLNSLKARVLVDYFYPDVAIMSANPVTSEFDFTYKYVPESDSHVIGGVIRQDTIMPSADSFIVNRSMVIDEAANFALYGVTLNFTSSRGLVVLGNIHLGRSETNVKTVLRGYKGMSWNGFNILDSDVKIKHTEILDTKITFNVRYNSTIHIEESTINNGTSLLESNNLNGHLSFSMTAIKVHVSDRLMSIKIGTGRLKINLEDSHVMGRKGTLISQISQMSSTNITPIDIDIKNTTFEFGSDYILNMDLCSKELRLNISSSEFAVTDNGGYNKMFDIRANNSSLSVSGNNFKGGTTGVIVKACNIDNAPKQNNFPQNIDIFDNEFHQIKDVVIGIHSINVSGSIVHNVFMSNGKCINASLPDFQSFIIANNTFERNTAEGIVTVDQVKSTNSNVKILQNVFENNTGTVVSFTSPNVRINSNIFDNIDADYNLKVSTTTSVFSDDAANATFNYWGTNDIKEIDNYIYDKGYDEKLLNVIVRPYFSSRNLSDLRNDDKSFLSTPGEIGGSVKGNITLTAAYSPYLVVSNIVVEERDVLRIEAGVTLVFKEDLGLDVFGIMEAIGSKEDHIKMVPEESGNPWRGLKIKSNQTYVSVLKFVDINNTKEGLTIRSSNAVLYNVSSSFSEENGINVIIDYTTKRTEILSDISVCHNKLSGIIFRQSKEQSTYGMKIRIDRCLISQNMVRGVEVYANANVELSECLINRNGETGVYIYQENGGKVKLKSCDIIQNFRYAIYEYFTEEIILEKCKIANHNHRFYAKYDFQITPYIVLRRTKSLRFNIEMIDNDFDNNIANGIEVDLIYPSRGNLTLRIENNLFRNSNRSININAGRNYYYDNMAYVSVYNNTFKNNINRNSAILNMEIRYVGSVILENNTFENNVAKQIVLMSNRIDKSISGITIANNKFLNDWTTDSLIDFQGYYSVNVRNNVFKRANNNSCSLKSPSFKTSYSINATMNYWGTHLISEIIETVCGFDIDMDRGFIYYIPFYIDDGLNQPISNTQDDFHVMGVFGGEVTGDFRITPASDFTDMLITRSIFVREKSTFTISAGTTLTFSENRGIYVHGTLVITGDSIRHVTLRADSDSPSWYGLLMNTQGNNNSMVRHTHVANTNYGIIAYTNRFEFTQIVVNNSLHSCITLRMNDNKQWRLKDITLTNCLVNGILASGTGRIFVDSVKINDATTGIIFDFDLGGSEITSTEIINCVSAVKIKYGYSKSTTNFTLERCSITNCINGLDYSVTYSYKHSKIVVKNNKFLNVFQNAFVMDFFTYLTSSTEDKGMIDIGYNTFHNVCDIIVKTGNNASVSFHENHLHNSSCVKTANCFLRAFVGGKTEIRHRTFNMSTNVFSTINTNCVVKLESNLNNLSPLGTFYFNQFLSTKSTIGTVLLDTTYFNFSHNIFDNPLSPYDIYVKQTGDRMINASNNWWGNADSNLAYDRIYDVRHDSSLVSVNITPVLTESRIDCSDVSNCSSHGECVSPNTCRCSSGWAGKECRGYDCGGVNHCFMNGQCIGPNTCTCSEGWSGISCNIPLCRAVNNCSGHGLCVRPNVCTCLSTFTGENCGHCIPFHWGEKCRPCPDCKHGSCNLTTGSCDCNGYQWTGRLCDKCSDTFYGPDCLPLITVLSIIPNNGLDTGGNDVHVWGHNFPPSSNNTYKCRFGIEIVDAYRISETHVKCVAPKHSEETVFLEISSDGKEYTDNQKQYAFYALCPHGSCGKDDAPPRGQCLFGGCSCNIPWSGDNCSVELLSPVLLTPADQSINESDSYRFQMQLNQGSHPVSWSFDINPLGMIIDQRTGLVTWENVKATLTYHRIKVSVTNIVGQHTVEWKLVVPLSYSVRLMTIEPNDVLPRPRSIAIIGEVLYNQEIPSEPVPISVNISSVRTGRSIILHVLTEASSPTSFLTIYNPIPDDAGDFIVTAHHPAESSTAGQTLKWSVMGMACQPNIVTWQAYINGEIVTYSNISKLYNIGGITISNITSKVYGIEDASVHLSGSYDLDQANIELRSDDLFSFDLIIRNAIPQKRNIYVVFSTNDKTFAKLQVQISFSIMKPVLVFTPNRLEENINIGTQKIFDINITNIGEVPANNVVVDLPNDPRLSLISFSTVDTISTHTVRSSNGISIVPHSSAILSLSVTIDGSSALGEMRGYIAVNTNLTSSRFPYRIIITSIQKLNLTFVIKDEYTYFASGSPLVTNAEVLLVNPRRSYSETKFTSNYTGYVTFENIFEDRYTVYAQAKDHSSYSEVIVASSDREIREIFLQRIAVTYTWTVTKTTFTDEYEVTLDSTFETFVPMPVITIEPAYIDPLPYEIGEMDMVDFTITNHGFIRADNLIFNLPTNHPSLHFESMVDPIGDLDANTSMIVPVKITPKSRTKRSGRCGMTLIYHYVCGTVHSRSVSVTLKGNCGGGGGVIGAGGMIYRSGSGSGIYYVAVTSLSCDCAITVVKSCILSYIPIVGCLISASGIPGASTGPDVALALLDTAMTCVVGELYCGVCGLVYTTVRCLMDLNDACKPPNLRRRREISSDVIDNMIATAKAMDNYITMMEEVFGNDEMFSVKREWYALFKTVIADNSANGLQLSKDEAEFVLQSISQDSSRIALQKFLHRWNETVSAWVNGTLNQLTNTDRVINLFRLPSFIEKYNHDTQIAKEKGFDSIFSAYDYASYTYNLAQQQEKLDGPSKKDSAICAKVRVRIVQDLVLTREAFNARLEIENGEESELENIHVIIEIRKTIGSGEIVNDLFSIGTPDLIGITAVDGTGRLGMDLSGSAEWLMIPYSIAAPESDTLFDVGGRLSYRVGGVNFSVPLLPDTITVKPNPSLVLHYFHEKYVRGDDPLTPEVEPIIPFSLAVLVMNSGYGVARALKISTAQPEIIENEKGLLVSFKIISAQLGNRPMTLSLNVDFGDIHSFETKTARWLLTSTLMGTFYNFSATFENINPLGDPQLSLFEDLRYHELIHLVQIFTEGHDDGLDDFLVNDFPDQNGIPEKLYNSANGSDVFNVIHSEVTHMSSSSFMRSNSKTYTLVKLTVSTNTSSWFYVRIRNNMTSPRKQDEQNLLLAVTDDHRELIVDKNVWLTTHISDKFLIHLLDFIKGNGSESIEVEHVYYLTFGPKNMYPPKFNDTSYSKTISSSTAFGTPIIRVDAYDLDRDTLSFEMHGNDSVLFTIDHRHGTISTNQSPLPVGETKFDVTVVDDGVPSLHSTIKISIDVTKNHGTFPSDHTTETTSSHKSTAVHTTETTSAQTSTAVHTTETSSSQRSTAVHTTETTSLQRSTAVHTTETTSSQKSTADHTTETTSSQRSTKEHTTETTSLQKSTAEHTPEITSSQSSTAEHTTETTFSQRSTRTHTTETSSSQRSTADHTTETTSSQMSTAEHTTKTKSSKRSTVEHTTKTTSYHRSTAEHTTKTTSSQRSTAEHATETTSSQRSTAEHARETTSSQGPSFRFSTATSPIGISEYSSKTSPSRTRSVSMETTTENTLTSTQRSTKKSTTSTRGIPEYSPKTSPRTISSTSAVSVDSSTDSTSDSQRLTVRFDILLVTLISIWCSMT